MRVFLSSFPPSYSLAVILTKDEGFVIVTANLSLRISPYSTRMREKTDQKKLRIWTLSTQCHVMLTKCLKQQNLFSPLWPDHNIRRANLPPKCKFTNSHSVVFLEKNGMPKSLPNLKVHVNYRQWCCQYNETFQIKHQIINFPKIHGIQET